MKSENNLLHDQNWLDQPLQINPNRSSCCNYLCQKLQNYVVYESDDSYIIYGVSGGGMKTGGGWRTTLAAAAGEA